MRPVSGPKLAQLNAAGVNFYATAKIEDGDGVLQDVSTFLGANWFDSATWTENIDQPVSSGTITLRREAIVAGTVISLSPSMAGSAANRKADGTFSPFLAAARRVQILVEWTAPGVAPVSGDWMIAFDGKIDLVNWKGRDDSTVTLDVRDRGAWLLDTFIEEVRPYSDDTGVAVEAVMQQILDDNPQSKLGAVVLHTPVSPGWVIRAFDQDQKGVLDALRDLAQQIGWDVRFRWNEGLGAFVLTFAQPDRTKTVVDWTLGPSQYIEVTDLNQSDANVRNRVEVKAIAADGSPITSLATDAASIAKFGERFMQVVEEATSNIDTQAEADAMSGAMLSDLKDPLAEQEIENYLYPIAEIGDLGGWTANGIHYDSDQKFAVIQVKHEVSREKRRTFIQSRGAVAGAYNRWLLLEASSSTSPSIDPANILIKDWKEIRRDATTITFGFTVTDAVDKIALYQFTQPAIATVAWPDGTTPPLKWLTRDTTEITVPFPATDNTTYLQVEPYHDAGGVLTRGDFVQQRVFAVNARPEVENIAQQTSISGLYTAVSLDLVDAQLLGGTVKAWTNPTSEFSVDTTAAPDGTVAVVSTPNHLDATTVWTQGDGSTATLLANVPVHPGRGKRIAFEFTNSLGVSSGIVTVVLLSQGGIIDENGDLIDAVIKRASQFAAAIAPVQVLGALPSSAPDNTLVFLTTDGQLYRRIGGAWTLEVKAVNLSGQVVNTQIADAAVSTAKFAAGIKPVELLSTTTGSPGVNRVAFNTTDGKLYRSSPDGTSWVSAIATVDLVGTINTAQITDAAITAAKLGAAAVQTANIAAAAITNSLIAAAAVTTTSIADGSISTPKLIAGSVTTAVLAAGAVTAAKITAGTITTTEIAAGTIVAANIASATITSAQIAATTITAGQIAANTITASQIAANTITSSQIAASTITAANIASATITSGVIAAGAITTTQLAASAVTAAKISAGTITTNEIAATTITGANIAGATITGTNIAATTITSGNLAANSIVAGKIAAGAINSSSLFVSGVVTATVISVSNLAAISSDLGIIVTGRLNSANGQSYINLAATGASPFIHHADSGGVTTMEILANGSATFSGTVASTNFTGAGATFSGGGIVASGGYLFMSTTYGFVFSTTTAVHVPQMTSDGTSVYLTGSQTGSAQINGQLYQTRTGAFLVQNYPTPVVIVTPAAPSNAGRYRQGDLWADNTAGSSIALYVHDGANFIRVVYP